MGSPKNKTTKNKTQLPGYLEGAYKGIIQAGANAAKQPYQAYTGSRVAGFTPQQQQGFGLISNAQGMGLPYINAASGAYGDVMGMDWDSVPGDTVDWGGINAASGAVMPGVDKYNAATLSQYQDPWQQYVIDSTLATMNREDTKQIDALKGSGIAMGLSPALGDRMGLAASDLAGQQAQARNATIAGLSSQGFQNAQQQLAQQQQLQLQGGTSDQARLLQAAQLRQQGRQADADRLLASMGYQQQGSLAAAQGIAGLGKQAQDMTYQGIDYLMNAGKMQQDLGQKQLDQTHQDWQDQQNYEKQQIEWLANLIYGSPGANATTQTKTEPGPSFLSQLAGLATAGAGLAKSWPFERGGRVLRRDLGGPIIDEAAFRVPAYTLGTVPTSPGLNLGGSSYINALAPLTPEMVGHVPTEVPLRKPIKKAFRRIEQAAKGNNSGLGGGGGGGGGANRGIIRRDSRGNIIDIEKPKKKAVGGGLIPPSDEPPPGTPEYDALLQRKLAAAATPPSSQDEGMVSPDTAPATLGNPKRSRSGEFFDKIDPLVYMGLGIMGGESPFALTNIGQGAAAGLKMAQDLYADELDAAPTVDDSGPTIRYWIPGEGWQDTDIPSYKWVSATTDKGDGTEKERYMAGKYGPEWRTNPAAIAEFEELLKTPQTMIDMKGSGAFATENAKGLSERMFQVMDGAAKAASLTSTYGQIATLLNDPNVYTGTGGETVNAIKKLGSTLFGIEGIEGVAAGEAAQQTKDAAIGQLREEVLGPGAMSNSDRQILEGIFPGLSTSAEGIQLAYEIQKIHSEASQAKALKLQEIMDANEGELTARGWMEFQNWVQNNPFFTPEVMRDAQARAKAATTQRTPLAGTPSLDEVRKKWGLE